ncbi:MAG TPA: DNA polymerase III subunit gamma/tau [Stellaceae bacterium]|jgi:DNA polymerase-3 subunit gamma/tau|nr:DNA polymerase III subunit gamma/tau [Stellaceae bacterium]
MTDTATPYRVLARKYRPQTFAEVIGQEAMVRTLSNAIATGRIAQAFILTGIRGTGKTTTARIIARALNCVGPDGNGGPTIAPCGECVHCRSIAEDRHVDVIEMDAASRTGVDDIRDLTEGVRYRPVSARFKIYIIDEVHMLSKNAFNALLKTLEEPPPDVKFVFATTEIHRVPVTVLSRCQRFSLRRVPIEQLVEHYRHIAAAEGIAIAPGALGLIARAADGSVRDGLSLLDQAIALSGVAGVEEEPVRDMLGIADRNLVFDLFETVLEGDAAGAVSRMDALYQGGADPQMVLQDLLDLTHFVTRLKLAPEAGAGDPLEDGDRTRAQPLAATLAMPVLSRAWQMLLKGIEEVQAAPAPAQAAAMVLVRLAYVADMPTPADLVRALGNGEPVRRAAASTAAPPAPLAAPAQSSPAQSSPEQSLAAAPRPATEPLANSRQFDAARSAGLAAVAMAPVPMPPPAAAAEAVPDIALDPQPQNFTDIVELFDKHREALLRAHLWSDVHLVAFDAEAGRIECRPTAGAPRDLTNRLGQLLTEWTGTRWIVAVSQAEGAPTLAEAEGQRVSAVRNEVAAHPLVRAVLDTFPGATIAAVRDRFVADTAGSDTANDEDTNEDGFSEDVFVEDGFGENGAISGEDEP